MVNLERSRSTSTHVDPWGDEYTLVSERLSLSFGGRHGWVGAGYNRPVAVVRHDRVRAVHDPVMLVRLVALLAVMLAMIIGTVRK